MEITITTVVLAPSSWRDRMMVFRGSFWIRVRVLLLRICRLRLCSRCRTFVTVIRSSVSRSLLQVVRVVSCSISLSMLSTCRWLKESPPLDVHSSSIPDRLSKFTSLLLVSIRATAFRRTCRAVSHSTRTRVICRALCRHRRRRRL